MACTKEELVNVLLEAEQGGIVRSVGATEESRVIGLRYGDKVAHIEWYKNISTLVLSDEVCCYFSNVFISTAHPRFKKCLAFTNKSGDVVLYLGIKHATA